MLLSTKTFFFNLIRYVLILLSPLSGWKIRGSFPNIPKFIVIVAPHTSFFDFWLMLRVRIILKLNQYNKNGENRYRNTFWLAKKSLFKWPIKNFIIKLGAISTDRSKSNNLTDSLARMVLKTETFVIGIAPDGTRRSHKKLNFNWKSGFYYLGIKAKIPIVPCYIDHIKKTIFIGESIYLKDTFNHEMKKIISFYEFHYKLLI